MSMNNKSFTLLEIIIVIIVIGVLTSLALPRLFATVEYSRSAEAIAHIDTIRTAVERAWLMGHDDFQLEADSDWGILGISNPTYSVGSHFAYAISIHGDGSRIILAIRKCNEGGTPIGSCGGPNCVNGLYFYQNSSESILCGFGAYHGLSQGADDFCGKDFQESWSLVSGQLFLDWQLLYDDVRCE